MCSTDWLRQVPFCSLALAVHLSLKNKIHSPDTGICGDGIWLLEGKLLGGKPSIKFTLVNED